MLMCDKLGLSSLRDKLEQILITKVKLKSSNLSNLIEDVALANKYQLDDYLRAFMEQNFTFKKGGTGFDVDLMMSYVTNIFIPDAMSYELAKNTINSFFRDVNNIRRGKIDSILLFLDLVFYDDRVVDLSSKQKIKKLFKKQNFALKKDTHSIIRKIECTSDFEGRATLVVEGHNINVNSFILTDNSPVFKAMLQSTSFKEGLTKTIELPEKGLDEVVYFLEFLHDSTKVIDGKFHLFIPF